MPAAMPPGTATWMVGVQVAELSRVIPVAVTTEDTPVRLLGSFAVYVAVPILAMDPAVYLTLLAGMAGPAGGVNAVEITLATQPDPAAGLRASLTCTSPSGPLIVPPSTVLARLPRLPAVAGTVIASAPPVTVTVAVVGPVVSADAGK